MAKQEDNAAKAAAAAKPIVVTYRDHLGYPVERTFSLDVHGEDFAALAEEFKASNRNILVVE